MIAAMEADWCFMSRAGIQTIQKPQIQGSPSKGLLVVVYCHFSKGLIHCLWSFQCACLLNCWGIISYTDCVSRWTAWKQLANIMLTKNAEIPWLAVPLYLFVAFFFLIAAFLPASLKATLLSNIHSKPCLLNATRNLNARDPCKRLQQQKKQSYKNIPFLQLYNYTINLHQEIIYYHSNL